MPKIPFVGGSYKEDSLPLNSQVCQNLYPVLDKYEGKSVDALYGVPGTKQFYYLGIGAGNVGRRYTITISSSLGLGGKKAKDSDYESDPILDHLESAILDESSNSILGQLPKVFS